MAAACKFLFAISFAASLVWGTGCRKDPDAAQPLAPATDSSAQPPAMQEPATAPAATSAPGAGDQTQATEIEAAFASLSIADRAAASEQKICPVGGGPLGAMGTPVKVAVAGQDVFICCESCRQPLLDDPAKHLANIGRQPAAEVPLQ